MLRNMFKSSSRKKKNANMFVIFDWHIPHPPAPVTNPPPAPPLGPKKPTTKKGNENRKSSRVQNKARLAAARALKAKKAKMDKLVEEKRKRIADQQPKSIPKINTEKFSNKLVKKIS